jgi:uncharacterized protein (TIGR00730 family)
MPELKRVCVFTGSSPGARDAYRVAARDLGTTLARNEIGLVYGGATVGLMGAVADAVLEAGGHVTGVIPKALARKELAHEGIQDLRIVASMHERKALMSDLADGFIALPGGLGTLEELFEILTWSQLGIHSKPVGVLNVEGYYDLLLRALDRAVEERFARAGHRELVIEDTDPDHLLRSLEASDPRQVEKWLDRTAR